MCSETGGKRGSERRKIWLVCVCVRRQKGRERERAKHLCVNSYGEGGKNPSRNSRSGRK